MIIFEEKHRLPKFILIIYIIQYVVLTIYYLKMDVMSLYYHIPAIIIGILLFICRSKLILNDDVILTNSFFYFFNRKYDLKKIDSCKFDSISALGYFGGWGIRYSKKYVGLTFLVQIILLLSVLRIRRKSLFQYRI